ncbi:MAG: FIST N-terminal domain-containing protein [Negativicutes bacterium]|nr:FIST N-terminal domain-containing protein [Negativicutes bacterium]
MRKRGYPAIEIGHGLARGDSSFAAGAEAVSKAVSSIREYAVSAVLVFASVTYNLTEVLQGIHSVVEEVPVFGATTAGEIHEGIHHQTVTVVALASPFIRVHIGIGRDVSKDWKGAVEAVIAFPDIKQFLDDDSERNRELRRKGTGVFAMLFSPGNTRECDDRSFEIVEVLKEKFRGKIPLVGGSPADDWRMEKNYVLCGQQAYSDSLLLVMFETELQFGIAVTNGFRPTAKTATVTAVDGPEVLEMDGVPAADVFSGLVGLAREELEGVHLTYLTGATIGISNPMRQFSVNVASYITKRGGLRLTQPAAVGDVVTIMKPDLDGLISAGPEGLRQAIMRGGISDVSLAIVFYCALRPRIMGEHKAAEEIAGMMEVLSGKPLIGFCSFGEQGISADGVSRHNNSAVACLVLGNHLSQTAQIALENYELLTELEVKTKVLVKVNDELWKEIAEREKAEEALRESEAKLKDFAQAFPDISLILDEDGRCIEILGGDEPGDRPQEESVRRTARERFQALDAEAMLSQIRRTILSGIPQSSVYEVNSRGEKRFYESWTAPMRYLANGKKTVAVVGLDVTGQWKAKRMLALAYELRRRSDFLNELIAGNTPVNGQDMTTIESLGICLGKSLFCCLLSIEKISGVTVETSDYSTDFQMLKNSLIDLLSDNSDRLVWDCTDGIGILCQTNDTLDHWESSMQFALKMKEKVADYDPGLEIIVGVSNKVAGPDSIWKGYRQAWSAVVSARCKNEGGGMVEHFRDLGLFQLLANLGGEEQAGEFVREKIGKLIDYDRLKGTNFLFTLEQILQSTNLKEAAEKMYLHHKTMVFRKRRIENLLGGAIDQFETRLALAAAVKLHKLGNYITK